MKNKDNFKKLKKVELDRLYSDMLDPFLSSKEFRKGYDKLDIESLSKEFNDFCSEIKEYNHYHRAERRLWYLKIGKGRLSKGLEQDFIEKIPLAKKHFNNAFGAISNCLNIVLESGLSNEVNKKLHLVTKHLSNEQHPLTTSLNKFYLQIGCSQHMIESFKKEYGPYEYDFINVIGGDLNKAKKILEESRRAQIEILDYTEKNGFSFLRGNCGPPAWAITAAKLLASVGISISAWAIVGIVVGLLVILILICESSNSSWVKMQCNKLSAELPIFTW